MSDDPTQDVLKIVRESDMNWSEVHENVRRFQESFRAEHAEDLNKRMIRNQNPYRLDKDDFETAWGFGYPFMSTLKRDMIERIVPVFVEADGERRQSGHAVVEIENQGIRPQYAVSIVLDVESAGMLDSFDISFNVKPDDPRTVTHVIAKKKED